MFDTIEEMERNVTTLGPAAVLARPVSLASGRVLPVMPALAQLLPEGGLRRGATLAVSGGSGATSLTLALLAAASGSGSWCGLVTAPDLGLVAAGEAGLDLSRVALLPEVRPAQWPAAVGALLDSVDLVVVAPPVHLRAGDARRLSTRARERGAVLVVLSGAAGGVSSVGAWVDGVDLRLTIAASRWFGLEDGPGRLEARQVEVVASGRGAAARPRRAWLWLPSAAGTWATAVGVEGAWAGADVAAGFGDAGLTGNGLTGNGLTGNGLTGLTGGDLTDEDLTGGDLIGGDLIGGDLIGGDLIGGDLAPSVPAAG